VTELINDTMQRRYEIVVDGAVAFVTYAREGDEIVLVHTEVPDALGGKGVGTMLARSVMEEARRLHLKVIPKCDFIAGFIKRHAEFADLVADTVRQSP
jgi:predicted GNAT family acetyltransferase